MDKTQQQDFYEVLQVSPRAHPIIINKAFRLLAALYHPDNKQTGDEEAFKQVAAAYRTLSDPLNRAAYDREKFGFSGGNGSSLGVDADPPPSSQRHCKDERELRQLILRALYDVRRGRPYKPNLSLMVLSEMFGCPIEDLQCTLWYLRGKRFIEMVEDSDLAITVDGVDHLEIEGLGAHASGRDLGAETIVSLPLPNDVTAELSSAQKGSRNGNGSGH